MEKLVIHKLSTEWQNTWRSEICLVVNVDFFSIQATQNKVVLRSSLSKQCALSTDRNYSCQLSIADVTKSKIPKGEQNTYNLSLPHLCW